MRLIQSNLDYDILRTSIIRISGLSGLLLYSQFCYEYLLIIIKIRSNILYNTIPWKSAVKGEFVLLLKSKRNPRML